MAYTVSATTTNDNCSFTTTATAVSGYTYYRIYMYTYDGTILIGDTKYVTTKTVTWSTLDPVTTTIVRPDLIVAGGTYKFNVMYATSSAGAGALAMGVLYKSANPRALSSISGSAPYGGTATINIGYRSPSGEGTGVYYTVNGITKVATFGATSQTFSVSGWAAGSYTISSAYVSVNTDTGGVLTSTSISGTLVITPPKPPIPEDFRQTGYSSDAIEVAWTESPGATSYTVTYRPNGTTDFLYKSGITSTSTILSPLLAATAYDMAVLATNAGGNSLYCTTIIGYTQPNKPTIPTVGTITTNSIQAKSTTTGVYTDIKITCEYQKIDLSWGIKETIGAANDTYVTFNGLTSGVNYRFIAQTRTYITVLGVSIYSDYSDDYSSTYTPLVPTPTATISTISGTTIGNVSVSWSIDAPLSGTTYYINVSTNSNMSGYVTKKTLTSYSSPSSIAVDNYNITYYCQIFATYGGNTTYSNIKSFSITLTKPPEWSWTTTELNAFNGNGAITVLTQARYNEFLGRINSAISYDNAINGHTNPLILSTEQMQSDKILYASSFLAVVTKLNNLSPTYITTSYIAQGNDILGQYFTLMQTALNTYL